MNLVDKNLFFCCFYVSATQGALRAELFTKVHGRRWTCTGIFG